MGFWNVLKSTLIGKEARKMLPGMTTKKAASGFKRGLKGAAWGAAAGTIPAYMTGDWEHIVFGAALGTQSQLLRGSPGGGRAVMMGQTKRVGPSPSAFDPRTPAQRYRAEGLLGTRGRVQTAAGVRALDRNRPAYEQRVRLGRAGVRASVEEAQAVGKARRATQGAQPYDVPVYDPLTGGEAMRQGTTGKFGMGLSLGAYVGGVGLSEATGNDAYMWGGAILGGAGRLPYRFAKYVAMGYGKGFTQMGGWGKVYGHGLMGNWGASYRSMRKMQNPMFAAMAAGTTLGVARGGADLAVRKSMGVRDRPMDGYFPGGSRYLPAGRGGISHNNLSTTGLTLGIHKNRFRTATASRVV